jgi:hypothetical protein
MPLPITPNTTMDIYRSGNTPPSAPDVASVSAYMIPDFANAHQAQTTSSTTMRWTHVALVPTGIDIRDAYTGGGAAGETLGSNADSIYIPDKTGTGWAVVFVQQIRNPGGSDFLKVFLLRQTPSWGTAGLQS